MYHCDRIVRNQIYLAMQKYGNKNPKTFVCYKGFRFQGKNEKNLSNYLNNHFAPLHAQFFSRQIFS